MPLDPAARALIDALDAAFPRVGVEVFDAVEARRILEAMPRTVLEPVEVARVEDRVVAGGIPVRIYWPSEQAGELPLVTFFHGGGWTLCNLETHDGFCRALTMGAGVVVVSVDYRLAPEHRYPAPLDDAYAAVEWASANAGALGADAARLAVVGDSAGGNLAAAVALLARDRGGPPIAFQLLVYPVLDSGCDTPSYRENAEGYFLTATQMRWYWDQYCGADVDRTAPYVSPLRASDLAGLPPAHIVTAEFDPLRDEGEAYGERLRAAGVQATVRRYDGVFHGFFSLGAVLEGARRASEEAYAAIRSALAKT